MASVEHDRVVVDQFTRQAIPFARAPQHQDGIDAIRTLARLAPAAEVLDVACGPGLVGCAIAPFVARVTGIDLTPEMIAEATRAGHAQGLTNVEWQLGTAVPLPFADQAFDVVLTRYSFHHFSSPAAAFREMCRVCRIGGRVVVADLCLSATHGPHFDAVEQLRDPSHVRVLSPEELRQLFRDAPITDLQEDDYGLNIELEPQLERSFPVEGRVEEIRRTYRDNVANDTLGIQPRIIDGRLWSTWPVRILAGTKTED